VFLPLSQGQKEEVWAEEREKNQNVLKGLPNRDKQLLNSASKMEKIALETFRRKGDRRNGARASNLWIIGEQKGGNGGKSHCQNGDGFSRLRGDRRPHQTRRGTP